MKTKFNWKINKDRTVAKCGDINIFQIFDGSFVADSDSGRYYFKTFNEAIKGMEKLLTKKISSYLKQTETVF